jgi:hypothetical protein
MIPKSGYRFSEKIMLHEKHLNLRLTMTRHQRLTMTRRLSRKINRNTTHMVSV